MLSHLAQRIPRLRTRGQQLLDLLQGDWSQAALVHWCIGAHCPCGGTQEKAIDAISEALSWLVVHAVPPTPSLARWTTLGPCVAWLTLGVLAHRILPQAWEAAFSKERPAEAGSDT